MQNPTVALDTNHGRIVLELYADKAPKTVQNFLDYVASGFFDGTLFHRVIPGFMIQGGGSRPARPSRTRRTTAPATPAARSPWRAPTTRTAPRPSSSST
jgi:cyclophilin family peptidyl-prolyl cis-trans isomerase